MNSSMSIPMILLGIVLFVVVIIGVFSFYNNDKSKNQKDNEVLLKSNESPPNVDPSKEIKKIHKPSKENEPSQLDVSNDTTTTTGMSLDDNVSVLGGNANTAYSLESVMLNTNKKIEPVSDVTNYLNLARARRYITKAANPPPELTDYTLTLHKPSTTIFASWDSDSTDLQNICNTMCIAVRYLHTLQQSSKKPNPYPYDEENRIKLKVNDFVNRLVLKFNNITNYNKDPWGKKWYPFSCILCPFLAHYLLLEGAAYADSAATIILNIINTPLLTLGSQRKTYASTLLGPWLLAHHIKKTLKTAVQHEDYKKARDSMLASITTKPYDNGVHMDGTIFHYEPPVFTYNTFRDTINDRNTYYFYMDSSLNNQVTIRDMWDIVMKKITHPNINLGLVGIYGRIGTNEAYINPQASYGIEILPFARFIRYNTKSHQFSARGQDKNIACYQMDHSIQNLAKYWVQYRKVHKSGDKAQKLTYPTPGLIYHSQNKNDVKRPFVDNKNKVESLMPIQAESYVMRYKNYGILYNTYEIDFEVYIVTEYIIINSELNTITIYMQVDNKQTYKLEYITHDDQTVAIAEKAKTLIITTYDLNKNEATHKLETFELETYAGFFGDSKIYIEKHDKSDNYILYDEKRPKVLFPMKQQVESVDITVNINNEDRLFKFNFKNNQYEIVEA